jgi:hypothetical protein
VQWIDAFDRPVNEVGRELRASLKAAPPPLTPRLGVAWLRLALPVAMLLLALLLRLQPPWPEPSAVGLFSLVAMLAPALGSGLFMPQLRAPAWLKRSLWVSVCCLGGYAILWNNSIYEARPRTPDDSSLRPIPKIVGGLLLNEDVKALIEGPNRIVGLTAQMALEEASFDPDLVWIPWTVRFNQAALLLCWMGLFAGVGLTLVSSGPLVPRAPGPGPAAS